MVCFGQFEFDPQSGELRRNGRRVRIDGQPLEILRALLERPGEVVTREELRTRLWANDTYVNFEQSLNAAVKRLRQGLLDSPRNPRFVETMARRGYRFIAPVQASETERVHSLAVLPFANESGDPDTEYLTDGITESIIHSLSRLPAFRVMARSTVFQYKARGLDPQAIGRKLNVRAVLMGRVVQRADAVVIAAELVDVQNGWRLWGEQYNRHLADIMLVEAEISREISVKLHRRLTGEDRTRLAKRFTESPDAYQDYLKGRYHLNQITHDGLSKAVVCFEAAIAKDPRYALAYTGLADTYSVMGFFGMCAPEDVMPQAREAALKAIAIDEGLAEAHTSLAGIYKVYDRDWIASEREFRRALEIDPNIAGTHRAYAAYLAAMGRADEAVREIELARALDPMSLVISMEKAWNLYMARDFEGAVEQASRTLESSPEFAPAWHVVAVAKQQKGLFEEAEAAFAKTRAASQENAAVLAGLAYLLAVMDRREEALAIGRQLDQMTGMGYVSAYSLALLSAGLGQVDLAMERLEAACAQHDQWLVWLKAEPRFDCLRGESRFQDLLRRLGFLPWQQSAAR